MGNRRKRVVENLKDIYNNITQNVVHRPVQVHEWFTCLRWDKYRWEFMFRRFYHKLPLPWHRGMWSVGTSCWTRYSPVQVCWTCTASCLGNKLHTSHAQEDHVFEPWSVKKINQFEKQQSKRLLKPSPFNGNKILSLTQRLSKCVLWTNVSHRLGAPQKCKIWVSTRCTESEALEVGPAICVLTYPLGDSAECLSLRTTG